MTVTRGGVQNWQFSGQLSWTPLDRGYLLAVAGGMWQGEGWALRAVALLQLVLAGLFVSVGQGSESPDRECCDPLYPFIPVPPQGEVFTTTEDYRNHRVTPNRNQPPYIDVTQEQQPEFTTIKRWWPPEEPDWPNPTPRTTNKKKKTTTKATTIKFKRPGIKRKSAQLLNFLWALERGIPNIFSGDILFLINIRNIFRSY